MLSDPDISFIKTFFITIILCYQRKQRAIFCSHLSTYRVLSLSEDWIYWKEQSLSFSRKESFLIIPSLFFNQHTLHIEEAHSTGSMGSIIWHILHHLTMEYWKITVAIFPSRQSIFPSELLKLPYWPAHEVNTDPYWPAHEVNTRKYCKLT